MFNPLKFLTIVILISPLLGKSSNAVVTPLDEKVQEGKETIIRCDFTKQNAAIPRFKMARIEKLEAGGEFSYRLWVPPGYSAAPNRRWPCVFIASPGGNAKMGNMAPHLTASGYIVVMLIESKNGEDWPSWKNFLSAHDDAVKRLRIAEGFKFSTGLSGGSRCASTFVQFRPGFGGLFQQGAGFHFAHNASYIQENLPSRNFTIVSSIGSNDSVCFIEWPKLVREFPRQIPFFPLLTEEGHSWSSKETVQKAFLILEASLLENQTCNAETKSIAQTWLGQHTVIIPKITDVAYRINAAERTLKAAARQGMSGNADIIALKKALEEWKKDPAALKELRADDALAKFFLRTMAPGGKKQSAEFASFAKRYEGTLAGKKAAALAKGIEKYFR